MLAAALMFAGYAPRRPDFMTRVRTVLQAIKGHTASLRPPAWSTLSLGGVARRKSGAERLQSDSAGHSLFARIAISGWKEEQIMFALIIAVGALFLAVVVSAAIDPRPARVDDDEYLQTINGIALTA